ncbi:MAG: peptidylprolyl isomerase, partial [Betaproteobacteria bacterium]
MHDAQSVPLAAPSEISYLHGGYGHLPEALERAREGQGGGESVRGRHEPQPAVGEYDARQR